MRLAFLIFFCASVAMAQGAPPCGNYVDQSEPADTFSSGNSSIKFRLPHATGSANTIIGGIMGSPNTYTLSDDAGNTYTTSTQTDATNGQVSIIFFATISTTSANPAITISENATDQVLGAWAMECVGTWVSDVSGGARGTTSTVAAGSLIPSATGDLVVQTAWDDNNATPAVSSITAGTNFTLVSADRAMYGFSGQAQLYNSTSALNASYTISATHTGFVTRAVFFKKTATGTAFPGGLQVNCMKTFWINTTAFQSGASAGLPRTEQWACPSSNGTASTSAIFEWLAGGSGVLTSVVDGSSETFNMDAAATCPGGGAGCVRTAYYCGATLNSTQTVTVSGTADSDSAKMYGVNGLATSSSSACFDKQVTANGTQAAAGNINAGSITPTTSNGLVIGGLSVANNTMNGVTGSGQLFTGCRWGNQTVGNGGCDQNNGWAYYLNPNTSSVNFTYTEFDGSTAAGAWVFRADAFEAPSSGAATIPQVFVIHP